METDLYNCQYASYLNRRLLNLILRKQGLDEPTLKRVVNFKQRVAHDARKHADAGQIKKAHAVCYQGVATMHEKLGFDVPEQIREGMNGG